jgi:geranylgeranyl diphosphate synthase type II
LKAITRIEQSLAHALASTDDVACPPKLAGAIRHAVFPGGARIRPRLCLAVAHACGDSDPILSDAAAVAIELLHCASLVHDDLPCFDDASTRRGRASVHYAFGECLAVLAGDALIVLAYETVGAAAGRSPDRLPGVLTTLCAGVGLPGGIVAGQAWESESKVSLKAYQQAKTGALFIASTACGAQAAGADPAPWRPLGDWLGQAYQVADDIRDVVADPHLLGKPVGRDAALGRPSVARDLGLEGAVLHFRELIRRASDSIPECPGATSLRALVQAEASRLVPMTADRLQTTTSVVLASA